MRKFLAFLLCFVFAFSFPADARVISEEEIDLTPLPAVPTVATAEELELNSKSAILMEPTTGKILYESNQDEKIPPASITKIMSLILIMEAIENGQFGFDTMLSCSETAASLGGSQIWLEVNEQMSVHDLIKAVAVVSANDATVLLAEAVAGSEESFVNMMNQKAKALGMNNTNFVNSTGLDHENHYSSAHDVAIMSAELLKHEKITEYTTIWMDALRNGESELVSTNKLVRFYKGCTGLKTGTTAHAGYCLSASAKRDGLELVAVVMGADTSAHRFGAAQKLLNYGFANFTGVTVTPDIDEGTVVPVKKGTVRSIGVKVDGSFSTVLKKSLKGKITTESILPDEISAPIKKGQAIGQVRILLDGEEIGNLELVATENAHKINLWRSFVILLKYLFSL
ncbi:MAG: D-alanyl-D-alanine carboxypeptidase [Clostridia bacterium]|nr:D-alanyl-D-alanine carboxypeptidase [Clostridia bacterium]